MSEDALFAELLDGPYPCCLSTLRADGSPYSVVVWCGRDGDRVTVNAAEGRWLDNVRRDPRVSLVVVDTANILRHVGVDGVVVSVERDEDYAHIDGLSPTYMGGRYRRRQRMCPGSGSHRAEAHPHDRHPGARVRDSLTPRLS